jgi:probable phosphoglycerate mutase
VTATTVFLVRHATHDRLGTLLCGRMPGVRLGAAGAAEAARLARRLGAERLAALYSSPRERAVDTAAPLAEAAGVPLTEDPDLDELDYGDWSGKSWAALEADAAWRAWNEDRAHRRPPAGETLVELQARLARWLSAARDRHPGAAVAAVSHAEPIKAALLWVMGAPLEALSRFEVSPASVSTIIAGSWGFRVHGINEPVR